MPYLVYICIRVYYWRLNGKCLSLCKRAFSGLGGSLKMQHELCGHKLASAMTLRIKVNRLVHTEIQ